MSNIIYDCVIIGGGISGISFAHYLSQQGKKVLILEKNKKTGGQVQSPVSAVDNNYWLELGAHTCYNSYTHLLGIVKDLNAEKEIVPLGKGSWMIYAKKKITSAMTQINYPTLILNGPKLFFSKRDGKTVKEYFENIVGKGNYDYLFTHMFHAVLSQNADNYPAEIFMKRRDGRMEEFPRKFSFSHGLQTILDLIIEKNEIEVITSTEVTTIDLDETTQSYTINTADDKLYTTKNIAYACGTQNTARLIGKIEPELAELLNTIPSFHSESTNVVLAKEQLKVKPLAGIIPVSEEFHSAVSRDLVEDDKLRSFTFHFPEGEKKLSQKNALIREVLQIEEQDILEIQEEKHVLPSLRLQHLGMAQEVESLKKHDSTYVLGNYFYGLSLEDCVNRSKDEANRFIKQNEI